VCLIALVKNPMSLFFRLQKQIYVPKPVLTSLLSDEDTKIIGIFFLGKLLLQILLTHVMHNIFYDY